MFVFLFSVNITTRENFAVRGSICVVMLHPLTFVAALFVFTINRSVIMGLVPAHLI